MAEVKQRSERLRAGPDNGRARCPGLRERRVTTLVWGESGLLRGWGILLPMLCRWGASVWEWGCVAAAEPTLLGALPLRFRCGLVAHDRRVARLAGDCLAFDAGFGQGFHLAAVNAMQRGLWYIYMADPDVGYPSHDTYARAPR